MPSLDAAVTRHHARIEMLSERARAAIAAQDYGKAADANLNMADACAAVAFLVWEEPADYPDRDRKVEEYRAARLKFLQVAMLYQTMAKGRP